jgi:hypothetical protein
MRSIGNGARPVIWIVLVAFALSGCGGITSRPDLMRSHFGIRPDEPAPPPALTQPDGTTTEPKTCKEYKDYVVYAQQLQEAYHSRASQNRAWIYVAAILGLGVAAASGGLAAATAVGVGTLGLLSISGGFSAAAFATISNADLAQLYTIAANQVDQALKESDAELSVGAGTRYDDPHCAQALGVLKAKVSEARTALEVNRTNTAAGAIARAVEQRNALDKVIAGVQAGNPTKVTLSAEITDVAPAQPRVKGERTQVTLTVKNIRLNQVAQDDVKVIFGTKEISLDDPAQPGADNTYTVKFTAPADPPDPPTKIYASVLLVGKAKERVRSLQGGKFTYRD